MASAHKKVIVRRFLGDILPGYLPVSGFVHHGAVSLLDLQGRLNSIALNEIKHVSYVRDFNLGDSLNPERLARRTFLSRPRSEGLWIRITFRTPGEAITEVRAGDLLEGLATSDLSLMDDLLADTGVHLTPPDIRSNTQRIFVPRSSMADLQILALITSPSRRRTAAPLAEESLQDELFHMPLSSRTSPN